MTKTLKRKALLLSYFTIGYNVVECLLALLAGYLSGSIALVGFGLDSLLECLSGGVMIWRFYPHRDLSAAAEARLERRAVKIIGYTFFFLAAYIFYESVEKLLYAEIPEPQSAGPRRGPGFQPGHAGVISSSNYAPASLWGAPA